MTFAERLKPYTAAQIMEATGCKRNTAYSWKDGTRQPVDWSQDKWLDVIAAHVSKAKKKKAKQ